MKEEFAPLFPRTRKHLERVQKVVPGGNVRSRFRLPVVVQMKPTEAACARLWDIDGWEHVDGAVRVRRC